MGESACLRRSLSHPSSAFRHPPETDPIRCLTESVSFGRFVSESLDWERWSTFSHNRYLEEVQQISKAGSVAEKKAFFEAHYKRRAAMKGAAELDRDNVEAGSDLASSQSVETVNAVVPDAEIDRSADAKCVLDVGRRGWVESDETGVVGTCSVSVADLPSVETVNVVVPDASADAKCGRDVAQSDGIGGHSVVGSVNVDPCVHLEDQMQVGNAEARSDPEPGTSGRTCSVSVADLPSVETVNFVVPRAEIDHSADVICVGSEPSSVNLEHQMQFGHAESCPANKVVAPEERTDHEEESVALRASKRPINASRITSNNKAPKLPRASVKREAFSSMKAGSPFSGSTSGGLISEKNLASKTVHMSINFSSCPGEKIRMSPRKSKVNSTTSWNPTRASVHGLAPGTTSKPEQCRRHNLPVNKSISGRNITSAILQTVTGDRSRSSISNGSKAKPVTVSSPFRFRSEERAAKRREARINLKLEERCNGSEGESIYQEGKQRCEITKTQQSANSGPRLVEAPRHESESRTRTTRMSVVSPQPPKSGRKPPSSESAHAPPQRTLDSAALPKRNRLLSLSVTSSPQQRKKGHENASPNIQS